MASDLASEIRAILAKGRGPDTTIAMIVEAVGPDPAKIETREKAAAKTEARAKAAADGRARAVPVAEGPDDDSGE